MPFSTSTRPALCHATSQAHHFLLQEDLAAKYQVIFQNYGHDLEEVQKLYETHKNSPPLVRDAPPVAGNIMWARQLLRRIELPMKRCALRQSLRALHTACKPAVGRYLHSLLRQS